jgi:hypothetical protein
MTIDHSFGTDDRLINRGFGLYGKVTDILPDGRFQVIVPDVVAMSSIRKQYTLRRFPIGVKITENRKVLKVAVSALKQYFLGKTIVVRCYKEYPNHVYLFIDDGNFVKNNVSNASDFCIESGFGVGI